LTVEHSRNPYLVPPNQGFQICKVSPFAFLAAKSFWVISGIVINTPHVLQFFADSSVAPIQPAVQPSRTVAIPYIFLAEGRRQKAVRAAFSAGVAEVRRFIYGTSVIVQPLELS
jgi:hypothetical protein